MAGQGNGQQGTTETFLDKLKKFLVSFDLYRYTTIILSTVLTLEITYKALWSLCPNHNVLQGTDMIETVVYFGAVLFIMATRALGGLGAYLATEKFPESEQLKKHRPFLLTFFNTLVICFYPVTAALKFWNDTQSWFVIVPNVLCAAWFIVFLVKYYLVANQERDLIENSKAVVKIPKGAKLPSKPFYLFMWDLMKIGDHPVPATK